MTQIDLPSGTIEYLDTGGAENVVVLVHGVLMNGTLWQQVTAALSLRYRCVVPTLPLGGHAHAMPEHADLTLTGVTQLLDELLAALDLRDVTLVGSDTGGALAQILVVRNSERVARLVLTSCEAFDNYPPGLPGKVSVLAVRLWGGPWLIAHQLRWAPLWRLPITFGWMAKRPISPDIRSSWMAGLRTSRGVRRDIRRFIKSASRRELTDAAQRLHQFSRPALVVWAAEDKVMPTEHGRALANLLPAGRFAEVPDSYTLIPLDQPQRLAAMIDTFITGGDDKQ
jgi:pimeloyl-ACP methyl ester carboxylesterase